MCEVHSSKRCGWHLRLKEVPYQAIVWNCYPHQAGHETATAWGWRNCLTRALRLLHLELGAQRWHLDWWYKCVQIVPGIIRENKIPQGEEAEGKMSQTEHRRPVIQKGSHLQRPSKGSRQTVGEISGGISQRQMWQLILCVNLIGSWDARHLVRHYSGCLWGCFRMNLTFESVDWEKQIALPYVGVPIKLVRGLNRIKGWPSVK